MSRTNLAYKRKWLLFSSALLLVGVVCLSVGLKSSRAAKKSESAATPQTPANLQGQPALDYLKKQGIYDQLRASMEAASYEIDRAPKDGLPRTLKGRRGGAEVYTASNAAQNLGAYFSDDRVMLQPLDDSRKAGAQASLQLRDYGYGSRMLSAVAGTMRIDGNRVEIIRELGGGQSSATDKSEAGGRGKITEWYINSKEGIEQGFTLDEPPGERQGSEPLRLRMSVTGKVGVEALDSGKAVALKGESGEVWLSYDHLLVKDARGRELSSRFEAGGREISLVVDDADAVYPLVIDPLFSQTKKITASDAATGDHFGLSVSISGDIMVVGASFKNSHTGAAYIYSRNQGGADNWGEVKKLTASDAVANDSFGCSVSIDGDTIVVGAYGLSPGAGAAYVFGRNQGGAGNWGEVKKLTPGDGEAGDKFGYSVAISGETIVVGAYSKAIGTGVAYVFGRNQGGADNWGQVKTFTSNDAAIQDFFGISVAINGDTMVVGADFKNSQMGAAYIFSRNQGGADNWGQVKKLLGSDTAVSNQFGHAVSIDGDTIVVSANQNNSNRGAAYVFSRNQGGTDNWGEVKKLTASDAAAGDAFGHSVSIDGDTIVTGADFKNSTTGAAYVYSRNHGGADNWGEVSKLVASDAAGGDQFGNSVAVDGNTIIVGAGSKSNLGAAYIFKLDQSITVNTRAPLTAEYGTQFTVAATASSGLPVTYTSSGACTNVGATFTMTSGTGTCTVMYNQAGDSNYNAAPQVIQTVSAQKTGVFSVTLSNLSHTYDGTAKFANVIINGPAGLAVVTTYRRNGILVAAPTDASSYAVSAIINDPNYIGSATGTLVINKANQTISFGALPAKTYGDAPLTVSATGGASGNAVTFGSRTPVVCSVSGNTVTILAAGTCTILASQADNNNYNAATNVNQSFAVAKAASTTTVTSSANPAGSGQNVTFTATVSSPAGTPTGTVTFRDGVSPITGCTDVALVAGQAACTTSTLTVGAHSITADYSGDINFDGSTSTLNAGQQVNPLISINDVSVAEGNNGTTNLVFTVTLSAASDLQMKVDYATADGTATVAGNDYFAANGTLTFVPGDLTKQITVQVQGDIVNEANETFLVNLSNPVNATISDNQGVGTILNDDGPGVQFGSNAYSFDEGAGHGNILVTRTGDLSTDITVDYVTSDLSGTTPCQTNNTGIASDRCDYGTAAGTLRFAAGESQKTISLILIDDAYLEPSEQLTIRLIKPIGAVLGSIDTSTITITDNDTQNATANPIDELDFFIRQQYIDFLGREPEAGGFSFWKARMTTSCPAGQTCDRTDTSQRFFQSDEFQERGFYVYRLYDAVLGRLPKYGEFVPDVARLNGPQTVQEQRLGKDAYLLDFMNEPEFVTLYGQYLSVNHLTATDAEGFVNALCTKSGIMPASKQTLINNLQTGVKDPAHTLEDFILTPEMSSIGTLYYDRGFITMQYFGYLRRDPDAGGFQFWVNQLIGPNAPHRQDYRFMVGGFLQSDEYRFRFALISNTP
jgi:hypothetical protein